MNVTGISVEILNYFLERVHLLMEKSQKIILELLVSNHGNHYLF